MLVYFGGLLFRSLTNSLEVGNREWEECAIACAKASQDGQMAWPKDAKKKKHKDGKGRRGSMRDLGTGRKNGSRSERVVVSGEWLDWGGQSIGQIIKGGETLMSEWIGSDLGFGIGIGIGLAD